MFAASKDCLFLIPGRMKIFGAVFLLLSFFVLSCSSDYDKAIITYKVSRADYFDKIDVSGTVQAVVNYPVVPPPGYFGLTTVLKLAADGQHVMPGDTLCVLANREMEAMYRDELRRKDSLDEALNRTIADSKLNTALCEAQLATSEAQLKISSLDSLRMNFATRVERELLQLQIKRARIEKEKAEKKLSAVRSIGENDIRQIKSRITEEKARMDALADQVSSFVIISKGEGIVQRTESPRFEFASTSGSGSIGGPIREGSKLFFSSPILKFPDLSKMQISAEVDEGDFRRIESGQHVRILVDAVSMLQTTGKVNRKNLIGRNDQDNEESNVKFYEVIIDVDSCHSKMTPGLSASCQIELKDVKDTIFVPNVAIFEKDSMKVVYVKKHSKFCPVTVKTGFTGSSFTLIENGLSGDETIALSVPPGRLISGKIKPLPVPDTTRIHKPV
jgi:HlyD family secretion protein